MTIQIKTANISEQANLIDVLLLAFSTDPGARWTWPDPHQYLAAFPELVKAFGGKAFENESAYYSEGYGGASLWLPPDVHPNEEAMSALIRRTSPQEIQSDVTKVFEKMESYHPKESHWYLPMIGVDPFLQCK